MKETAHANHGHDIDDPDDASPSGGDVNDAGTNGANGHNRPARADTSAILVLGATGFVGRSLVQRLAAEGETVRAASRRGVAIDSPGATGSVTSVSCDLRKPETLPPALQGVETAYYLVHSMGAGAW